MAKVFNLSAIMPSMPNLGGHKYKVPAQACPKNAVIVQNGKREGGSQGVLASQLFACPLKFSVIHLRGSQQNIGCIPLHYLPSSPVRPQEDSMPRIEFSDG